jgi:pimeloyl-ACP methyl ester carboxylesterase
MGSLDLGACRRAEYEAIGDGEPLLYFTGGPGENAAILRDDANALGDLFAVYLIEPHGSDGSTPPGDPAEYDPAGHARFYDEARRALGIERATIMGFSFGGAVALAFAGLFPGVTERCIAIATRAVGAGAGADFDAEMERGLSRHRDASWYPSARKTWDAMGERVLATDDPADLAAMMVEVLPLYMAHPETPAAQARIAAWRRDLRPNLAAAKAWDGGLWDALDLRPLLAQIRTPTLVLAGDLDLICGPAHGRMIAKHVTGAELVTFPDCGHFIPTEAPDAFRAAVTAFCGVG